MAMSWSRALVARFILERFGIRYVPASIPHLLRREGIRLRARPVAPDSVAATDGAPRNDRPFPDARPGSDSAHPGLACNQGHFGKNAPFAPYGQFGWWSSCPSQMH